MRQCCIYKNPSDYPGKYVVRGLSIMRGTLTRDAEPIAVVDTLEQARDAVPEENDFPIARSPEDDPTIVETWI